MIEKRTCPNCQDNILIATKTTIRGVKDVAAAEDEGVSVGFTLTGINIPRSLI